MRELRQCVSSHRCDLRGMWCPAGCLPGPGGCDGRDQRRHATDLSAAADRGAGCSIRDASAHVSVTNFVALAEGGIANNDIPDIADFPGTPEGIDHSQAHASLDEPDRGCAESRTPAWGHDRHGIRFARERRRG